MLLGDSRKIDSKLIYDDFIAQVKKNPQKIALYQGNKEITYLELMNQALKIAGGLKREGIETGDFILVSLPRSAEMIEAILGVLFSGGVYIPVGIHQPQMRKDKIKTKANAKLIIDVKKVDTLLKNEPITEIKRVDPKQSAYIIFTSGSTGEPKGVVISHDSAVNTIEDVNLRFNITHVDCAIGVSAIDFDLSVYDIFGMLAVGGSLVILSEENAKSPDVWIKEIGRRKVTVWNSVPALFEMLLELCGEHSDLKNLRNVMLSGDWINLDIYGKLKKASPDTHLISLGGATEGSIWSCFYEVKELKPEWVSVPYGQPLSNQKFSVMRDEDTEAAIDEIGELWIGGRGVALGYLDEVLTKKSFVQYNGERWYRTGDYGKIHENGLMEFCGRRDQQVKINGFRIELGEIEKALSSHPKVREARAAVFRSGDSKKIGAFVVPEFYCEKLNSICTSAEVFDQKPQFDREQEKLVYTFLSELIQDDQVFFDDKYKYLLNIYKKFLEEKKNEGIEKQENYSDAVQALYEELEKNRVQYGRIFSGKEQSIQLLNNPVLSPENMSYSDPETNKAIDQIIEDIKHELDQTNETKTILIPGSQTGLFAEKIINQMKEQPVQFTILTMSRAFYLSTLERLKAFPNVEVLLLQNQYYMSKLYNAFDFIISIHQLHTYRENKKGILLLNYYLKEKGYAYIVEQNFMQPIALLTSAVLENGFIEYDAGRQANGSPMMHQKQWLLRLEASGLIYENTGGTNHENVFWLKVHDVYSKINESDLVEQAKKMLPYYMVPERIEIIPEFEKSANGKIVLNVFDEEEPEENMPEEEMNAFTSELAGLWKSVLNIENVSSKKSFFQMGGDSLLLTKLLNKIKEHYGIEYTMKQMFDAPYLNQMSKNIEKIINENGQGAYIEEGEI